MNFIKTVISIIIFTLIISADVTVDEIIDKVDKLYRSNSSYSEIEMRIITPEWERTLSMKVWSEGMEKTFIYITEPAREKGVSTLKIGNEMWNYLPKVDKTIKIPPSMMSSSWMGSDFTNDDLVRESSMVEDYTYKIINPDNTVDTLIYIEMIPKEETAVVWGKVILTVRETDYIPVEQKYYDEEGNLKRIMNFRNIKKMGGKIFPSIMEMIPMDKEGHKTIIEYKDAEFDIPLDKDIFSLRNMRKAR